VAGEVRLLRFSPSPRPEFVELFVGRVRSRVRELFAEARKPDLRLFSSTNSTPVGSRRGAGLNEERDQTLNQLLVEMDGFAKDSGILILAATNRPDALDPALLRPGRLTRRVFVGPPTQQGRAQILSVHLRGLDLEEDVDVVCDVISRATPGFTGAELANVANEAALLSVRDGRQLVSIDDMLDGVSRTKDGIATSGNRADAMFRELRSRFLGNYKDAPGSTTDTMKEKLGSKASSQGVPISMGPS
jgi:ATP-dependent Zn protease